MALEAGELMHQMFAAVRIWQLHHIQGLDKHAKFTGERIFGKKRWAKCWKEASQKDNRENLMQLAFAVLHSSGWEDDLGDSVRVMSNMELASIVYIDERLPYMDGWPIYVESKDDPSKPIGIEQVFDMVLLYSDGKEIRAIGTIDGLVEKALTNERFLDENKTASRLDAGWRASFDMSHQVTWYCVACTVAFGFQTFKSRVTGLKIKPTNKGEDIYVLEPIERTEASIQHWAHWLRYQVELFERYQKDFEHAPRFTKSCNRYFRPCSLLSFCCDSPEGRQEQWSQMVEPDKSPSERAISV